MSILVTKFKLGYLKVICLSQLLSQPISQSCQDPNEVPDLYAGIYLTKFRHWKWNYPLSFMHLHLPRSHFLVGRDRTNIGLSSSFAHADNYFKDELNHALYSADYKVSWSWLAGEVIKTPLLWIPSFNQTDVPAASQVSPQVSPLQPVGRKRSFKMWFITS